MISEQDRQLCAILLGLIPVVKKRVLLAVERSREDVEFELATLANLLTIKDRMDCNQFSR